MEKLAQPDSRVNLFAIGQRRWPPPEMVLEWKGRGVNMAETQKVIVRFFGSLEEKMRQKYGPGPIEVEVPETGTPARALAEQVGLPPEGIEAVFINGRVSEMSDSARPGDRIAFVPPGTPGPYRVLLGMVAKNRRGPGPGQRK